VKAPLQILLAEDSPEAANLVKEVLMESKIAHVLNVAADGEEALAFLRQQQPFDYALRPDVVLLDLNMPKVDGMQVLSEMKNSDLNDIPVIVLTMSNNEEEIARALDLKMNYYIRKPVDARRLTPLLEAIGELWERPGCDAHATSNQ
jgi:CheY-like chemotaxis protein